MIKRTLLVATIISAGLMAFSCGGSKKVAVTQMNGEVEVVTPCGEFFTDKDFFRGVGIGQSKDMNTAREKARMNANAEMATSIFALTKRVAERYVNDAGQTPADYAETFESLTREIVRQELNNVRVACNTTTKTPDGMYKCYMALEAAKDEVFEGLDRRARGNDKLKTLYDREKFREIYNQDMEAFANEYGK
jgi:hypothetical protein